MDMKTKEVFTTSEKKKRTLHNIMFFVRGFLFFVQSS